MTPQAQEIISTLAAATRQCADPSLRRYTLHSHTQYCDGRAQMEAFAAKAVEEKFAVYGFTPHSPITFPSPCNMLRDNVDIFLAEADRLARLHQGAITLMRGMEIDFLSTECNAAIDYFRSLPLDYTIGSVHFIKSQQGDWIDIDGHYDSFRKKMDIHFHNDIRYVVESFFEASAEMIATGGFDIIGHYDKIGHNAAHFSPGIEQEPWYRALHDDLTRRIIDSGIIIEINTKALKDHHRMFPAVDTWSTLLQSNAPIVVNSDAHVPALINAGRDQAFAIIDDYMSRLRPGQSTHPDLNTNPVNLNTNPADR